MHSTLKEDHIAITVGLTTSLSKQQYTQLLTQCSWGHA